MTEYNWPTDPTFRKVAAAIADAVTLKINSGSKVSVDAGCFCPLGCLSDDGPVRPCATTAGDALRELVEGLGHYESVRIGRHFANGFDWGNRAHPDSEYVLLGRAYAARFP